MSNFSSRNSHAVLAWLYDNSLIQAVSKWNKIFLVLMGFCLCKFMIVRKMV